MASVECSIGDSISTLHPDIIQTQILTRLDGPTLASTASTSSYLQTLCYEQKLWREISTATWPCINDSRVVQAISSFPSGYRSFFADSYSSTEYTWESEKQDTPTTGLISAVDLYYRGELIYSKVQEMETENGKAGWFLSAPFRVDLLDEKESVQTQILYPGGDYEAWVRNMEESMELNWIVIDPVKKRAANISSRKAVSAKRNWLTGDLEIRFSTVVAEAAGKKNAAEVAVVVSCGSAETWKEVDEEVGGEVHVRDVRLQLEDIEGKCLKGRDSLVILQGMLEGKRCCKDGGGGGRGKGRYEEYMAMKTHMREKKERREKAQDTICMIFGFSLFVLLWSFILLGKMLIRKL
ncbi:F-box protein At2g27310 [Brassica rapa]|uniref:F-box protein At2g27310 n=1 Tax=Brassica campestris TaxID=3711 RepID=UPI0004F1D350|nr:F-box protein At2g27310 [Brassica rapa]